MKTLRNLCSILRGRHLSALCAIVLPRLACAADARSAEEAISLSPFEVRTEKDTSYGALNSNSITRFNVELDKVPISADIFTEQFMRDVNTVTLDEMLAQYGAGMGANYSSASGMAFLTQPGDRVTNVTNNGFKTRGLSAGGIRMNGFVTETTNFTQTSNFNVERVEVLRGPQGLLYGPGGPAGTIVATTKQAKFNRNTGRFLARVDQYGSRRALLDVNVGGDRAALEVTLMNENNQFRRLFFMNRTNGYYLQFAYRLPFNTTFRTDWSHTRQVGLVSSANPTVNFGGTARDPRSGYRLTYLLFSGQTGANDPITGRPYPGGAVGNGHLTWENVSSYGLRYEINNNYNFDVSAETVWSRWLSTTVAFNFSRLNDHLDGAGPSTLSAPLQNGNPFNEWAVNGGGAGNFNNRRHLNGRATALITRDLFNNFARTQTVLGYDFQRQGFGGTQFNYYLSDASGNMTLSNSPTNLGRTTMPTQWWAVGNGPAINLGATGQPVYHHQNGNYYLHSEVNPRNPAWITPNNPEGVASIQFPNSGVSGNNEPSYEKQITNTGLYFANYTRWWDDRIATLAGYRYTYSANHIPNANGSTQVAGPLNTSKAAASSYNLGVDGHVTRWLRWYYSYSTNYNFQSQATDPYGRPVERSKGEGQEIGFKFTPFDNRVSGSLSYYDNRDKNDAVGGAPLASINPVGLNGQFQGSNGPAGSVPENYRSRGAELILTASPKPNWRIRFSATTSDGKVSSNSSYGILYNDQFRADARGNVTYADGSPFLVPVDPMAARIASLSTTVNPATILTPGVASQQLTTAMLGDAASPYYAWQGGQVTAAGNILPGSNAGRVLKNFDKPGVGSALTGATGLPLSQMQYAWPDPNNTGGTVIVTQAGQKTVGYPVYRVGLTNSYEFTRGPLKGFGSIFTVSNAWRWRTYYYNNLDRSLRLYSQPELGWQINLSPFYEHKFRRVTWRSQVDINNLTNHYVIRVVPNDGSGFNTASNLAATWYGQPRLYVWTNTFSF